MGRVFVGIDLGSTTCHVVAMDREKAVFRDHEYQTSERNLIAAVEGLEGEVHVHLEACELAAWARSVIKDRVKRVVVGHPKTNAWIAKDPLKGDQVDAYKLADLLRMDQVHEVFYADEPHRELFKEAVQHFDTLTSEVIRWKTKIKATLRRHGIIVKGLITVETIARTGTETRGSVRIPLLLKRM